MKLSKRKEKQLWDAVHNEIFNARIAILKLVKNRDLNNSVDDVLYKLCCNAPAKAIEVFEDINDTIKRK